MVVVVHSYTVVLALDALHVVTPLVLGKYKTWIC